MASVRLTLLAIVFITFLHKSSTCWLGPPYGWMEKMCLGGYAIRCNETRLEKIPKDFPKFRNSSRPCLLDLSNNEITNISKNAFRNVNVIKVLLLYNNKISRLDPGAFSHLTSLLILNLSSNALHFRDSFGIGVFKPLVNLEYINIKNNSISSFNGLQTLMKPLHNLRSLYLSGCYNCTFGKGFENFAHLSNVSLSGSVGSTNLCNISVLFSNTFDHIPQVENVYLSSCNISRVETSAFKPFRHINYIDISYNEELRFDGMRIVLDSLVNSTVRKLNFNRINEQFEMGLMLKQEHMQPIKYLNHLEELYIDLNKIEVIEEGVFGLVPKSVKFIAVSGNRLTRGPYVNSLHTLEYLESLDISYQHLNYDPFLQDHYENGMLTKSKIPDINDELPPSALTHRGSCQKSLCICLPPNLKCLKWRKSFVYFHVGPLAVCAPFSLETLDLSFNLILEWTGPVYGLERLKRLSLEENFCQNMSSFFFDTLSDLRFLNVSYNFLGPILKPDGQDDGRHFKNLKNLEVLDLSENRITALSADVFKNLKRLKHLNISRNMLGVWNSTLQSNCLAILDLSDNKLETLPDSLRKYLDHINALSSKDSCRRTEKVMVVLTGNPIQCNCDSRPFLRWLSNSAVDIRFSRRDECHLQDGSRLPLKHRYIIRNFVKHLDRECFPYVSVILSLCMFVVGVAFCITIYRYRWRLRHCYYSRCKRHRHTGYERLFDRDAFISYASTDARFIKRFLVPALEERRSLKVWVADRDSVPGVTVAENIAHAISFSKKTVILLSKRYFKEGWCDYEMNWAQIESIESKRKLFIIVLFEDIAPNEIPPAYLRLLHCEKSLEYPPNPQDQNTFWDSLCAAIQSE